MRRYNLYLFKNILWVGILCCLPSILFAETEWIKLNTAIHIHTDFSTGEESMEKVASLAIEHGVDVLVMTDDDLVQVSYGLPFLRNLTKYTQVHKNDIFSSDGLELYLDKIRQLDERHPDLILINGLESAPFYYWDIESFGKPFFANLSFINWNKHLIAIGLSEEDYRNLPVIGGEGNWEYHPRSLLLMWPLAGFVYVLLMARRHPAFLRWLVLFISVVGLVENFPFKIEKMDQYHGDLGAAPYQHYIDYVNDRGGMVFWPHPEGASTMKPKTWGSLAKVGTSTLPHAEDLVKTKNYTAFAALYGDNTPAIEPGQEWDHILNDYLVGKRPKPIWGTGEIDYHEDKEGSRIHDILTVIYVRERSEAAVVEGIREGRMYAVRGGDERLVLDRFEVVTETDQGILGETVYSKGSAKVHIALSKIDSSNEEVRVRLIRSGMLVFDEKLTTPFSDMVFEQNAIKPEEKLYYRLLVNSKSARLAANPIFVTGTEDME